MISIFLKKNYKTVYYENVFIFAEDKDKIVGWMRHHLFLDSIPFINLLYGITCEELGLEPYASYDELMEAYGQIEKSELDGEFEDEDGMREVLELYFD